MLDFSSANAPQSVTVNGYPLIPVEPQQKTFEAVTLNTSGFNTIEVDGNKKRFRLFRIHPGDVLKFSVNNEVYSLNLFPKNLPRPDITKHTEEKGHIAAYLKRKTKHILSATAATKAWPPPRLIQTAMLSGYSDCRKNLIPIGFTSTGKSFLPANFLS